MNGEDALVTLLFVDIRDFTPFADRVTAREAVALLNEFFGVVVPVLEDHGGRVQQFLGDGMLGVFGAPEPLPDHADRGVAAARAIVAEVEAHFGERCQVSVGVNSGLVIVGTIGGGSRFDLGIIGDPVNVAARVEQATRRTGDSVLVTEATRCLLERDGLVPRGAIELKGKPAPVPVYALGEAVRRRLPLVLWILAVAAMLPAAVINASLDWGNTLDLVANVAFTLLILGAATTGAVVATRVPANAIGWTLLALGLGLAVGLLAGAYAEAGPLPADEWMAWLGNWLPLVALFGATAALLLLFPDGRLVSRRWRPVAWICAAGVALAGLGSALDPKPLGEAELPNPLGPEGAAAEVVRGLIAVTDVLALPLLLAAAASLVVRFRRARGVERLQLKWFTFDAAIAGAALGLAGTGTASSPTPRSSSACSPSPRCR